MSRHASDDGLDQLSMAFHARLQSERVHLATLSAALARTEENPVWIFQDLKFRAHKIQGGAAIFDIGEIGAAACALETAAASAIASNAENTDDAVWTALVALVRLIGELDGGYDPVPLSVADLMDSSSRETPEA